MGSTRYLGSSGPYGLIEPIWAFMGASGPYGLIGAQLGICVPLSPFPGVRALFTCILHESVHVLCMSIPGEPDGIHVAVTLSGRESD